MTDAILLNKLITEYNDNDNFLYQCYIDSLSNSNMVDSFNKCIDDLNKLSSLSYDFKLLTEYSTKIQITRRDIRQLCEILSTILGETITQLCSQDREPIITKPSRFEDFCPYPKAELVMYAVGNSSVPNTVEYNGYKYRIIEFRQESTPYYFVYCYLLERASC